MKSRDPIVQQLISKGSPFEIATVDGINRFANAPQTLDALIETARRFNDRTFIVEGEKRLSFADVLARRDALAAGLNVNPGDRIAICMKNRSEWLIGFLAAVRVGAVVALINSRGSGEELSDAIASVEASLVLADKDRADRLRAAGYEGRIIEAEEYPLDGSYDGHGAEIGPDDPAVILFTSGTTGRVKGAVLSHRNVITGIMSVQMAGAIVLHNKANELGMSVEQLMAAVPQQSMLLVYPLFHISGLGASFLSPLLAGSKLVIMERWNPVEAVRLIEQEGITMFTGVPTMLWDLLNSAALERADLSSVTNIGMGGQALPINLLDSMREACPHSVMGTGYGLTETAGSVAMALGEDFIRKRDSAGRVMPLVETKIVDADGQKVLAGEAGEIVVRGAQVMLGYWGLGEETRAVLDEEGWFRTGDVGRIDDEGYLYIVDRKKDMVISGGENIYCAEVERVLSEVDGVVECATFGIPDARLGELLVAVVRGDQITEDAVKTHVGGRLARYKTPGIVRIVSTPLPRNDLGKIDKMKLRQGWSTENEETA